MIKSLGAYLMFFVLLAAALLIMLAFRSTFNVLGLDGWLTSGGSLQLCGVTGIGAWLMNKRRHGRAALTLGAISVMAGVTMLGSIS